MTNKSGDNAKGLQGRVGVLVWSVAAALWLAPLIASAFIDEMLWDRFDFALWALLLGVAAGGFHLATRISGDLAYRLAAGLALGFSFLTIWANLAVGVIGNENNPLNLLFFGVLLIAALASFSALLRPKGMVVAMIVTAAGQASVGVIAHTRGHDIWPFTLLAVTVWLAAAWMFRTAAHNGQANASIDKASP